jgi:hypothetical protein
LLEFPPISGALTSLSLGPAVSSVSVSQHPALSMTALCAAALLILFRLCCRPKEENKHRAIFLFSVCGVVCEMMEPCWNSDSGWMLLKNAKRLHIQVQRIHS